MSFLKLTPLAIFVLVLSTFAAPGRVTATSATPHPEFGMVLFYPLNGNALDNSGFNRDGTLAGPVAAVDKWGNIANALSFNGSGDYVSIPASATSGLTRFTFSMWIKTTESRTGTFYWTHPTIVGVATSGSGSGDFGICLNNGKPGFFGGLISGNDNSYYSATSVNDNTWHHLAAVNDGITVKLYIDGVLDTGGYIFSGLALANTGFYLGKSNLPDPLGYAGVVDELRIYSRALSDAEITLLATTPPTATVPLTITRSGTGSGSVTISPLGLVCTDPSCGVVLPPASSVTLKASPDVASFFAGWSGACSGGGDCPLTLSAPAAVTAAFAPWQNGLLAWYPFRGDAADASGNGNNGTVNRATPAPDRFGTVQSAYDFNGVDSSISLGGASSLSGNRTISIWVHPHTSTGYGMPIVTGGSAGATDFIGVGATTGPCNFGSTRLYLHHWGQACLDSTVNLTTDAWNHVTISFDAGAGTLTFYRNGTKVTSVAGSLYNYGISALMVGGNSVSGMTTKPSFKGSLDEVAIYNRALNDAEVFSLYYRQGVVSTITSPADGSSLAGSVITVTGKTVAVPGRQIGLVEVSVDGGVTWQVASDTSGTGTWGTWSYPWRPTAIGGYTIRSRARDAAGYYELAGPSITAQVVLLYTPTTKTGFSTAADYSTGLLDGVGMGASGLQLTSSQQPLPYLWVPNLNNTVSKVETSSGRELGRYWTVPTGVNGVNSRTTVDLAGNVWLGNRQAGSLVKIGLLENGQCIDRNGNGVIDTSRDTNGDGVIGSGEILPWAADECVLAEVIVIPGKEGNYIPGTYTGGYANDYYNPGPRSISVDASNNVWVGAYGTQKFYYLEGSNGKILKTVNVAGHSPYGAVMDANANVWSSGNTNNILKLDPKTDPPTVTIFAPGVDVYGITADHQGHIFTAGNDDSRLARINAATRATEWTVLMPSCGRGLAVDTSDTVWVASSCSNKVFRYSNSGTLLAQIPVPTSPTGVAIDSFDRVWAIGSAESVYRINPATNSVDLEGKLPGSTGHYAYSDMTGIVVRTITTRIGTWSVLHDGGVANKPWGTITWNADVPAGASFLVKVRSSNDLVTWSDWETTTSSSILRATPDGRYLMVMAVFTGGTAGETPVLHSLTIAPAASPLNQRDTTPPSGSILINNGAVVTNNTAVLLTLAATDNSGNVSRMRLGVDGSAWGEWVAYETSRGWTLATGDGPKKVYVQYRDVAGNISPAIHATIELHTSLPTTTVTPPGGCYRTAQTVTLTVDEPGTIYYTTDGSDPTSSATVLVYSTQLTISVPTLVRFYAKDSWGYAETVRSAGYSFMSGTPLESITPTGAGLPADGLMVWLRGDAGTCIYLDGKLSGWYDLSGNGNKLSGSGAVVAPNELNGKPVVKFDGSHVYAQEANAVTIPYTILTVSRQDGSARRRLIGSASTNWLLGYWSGYEDEFHADGWVYKPDTTTTGDAYLYTATGNGTTSSFYRNGAKLAENGTGKSAPGLLALGGSTIYGEQSDGKVAEVITYNRVLSDAERAQVETYLKTRYNLAFPVAVNLAGSGTGTVTSAGTPASISCPDGDCSATIAAGTQVALTATSGDGSVFWGWFGLCSGAGTCWVTMDKAKSVTAIFDLQPHPGFGMILYYPLDGDATDLSGFSRTGTLTGTTPAVDAWGYPGKALGLNGSDDYVQVPPFVLGGTFTVSAWVYANNVGANWQRLFDFGNGAGSDNILVTLTSSQMRLYIRQGATDQGLSTSEAFPQKQWVHVTITHDGTGTGNIYWNGALKASGAIHPPLYTERANQYIGKSNWNDPYFNGVLDEFRIYNRELSRSEIDVLAATPPPPVGVPLILTLEGAPGYNSVTINPGGMICSSPTCNVALTPTSIVTLTANPHETSSFTGWTGDCTGSALTCTLTMGAARNVTATFDAIHTGLIAYYPFTGDADDASGNGLHGTLNGPILATDRFGSTDRAYQFDGINDYILVGDPVPSLLQLQKEISLEAWVYVTQYPGSYWLIVGSQYDGARSGATIFLNSSGKIHFQIGNGSWHATNGDSLVPQNQWVHIVATRRPYENGRIYINGVLQPSTGETWTGGITYNNAWFAMGQQKDVNRPFKGKIDDVRIYSRALSATEVQTHFTETASDYTLRVTITSSNGGGGSVHSAPPGIACTTGACTSSFANDELVNLHASPDINSIFTGWSDACSGTTDCSLTMNADKIVGAGFTLSPLVRIFRTPLVPYLTLQNAYNAAITMDVIQMKEGILSGSLLADKAVTVILSGGYNPEYTTHTGQTTIQGTLTLKSGTVIMEGIRIK